MPRPTRELTTAGGHKLVLNEYITGGEHWDIRDVYIRASKSEKPDEQSTDRLAEAVAFQKVVVSVDGVSGDVAKCVFDLPLPDFKEVVSAVTEIVESKKKSESN